MRIVSDSKIAEAEISFSQLGTVETVETEAFCSSLLADADIILIRSETRVDAALLDGTSVKFVGSPTSGTDHIDFKYLARHQIGFANAPGSNARSVAEYVLCALLALAEKQGSYIRGKTLGVVGVGNIGSLVAVMAESLGMQVLLNDPPKQARGVSGSYLHLDQLLEGADFITLHVPLTKSGEFPTYHLFDEKCLNKLRPACVVVNSARGPVVDNGALKKFLLEKKIAGAVLDVWEDEPRIDPQLIKLVDIATAHIAGYSWDGKVKGTRMVFEAARAFFDADAQWRVNRRREVSDPVVWDAASDFEDELRKNVSCFYDIELDDRMLRDMIDSPSTQRAGFFSNLRKNYRLRREFGSRPLSVETDDQPLLRTLSTLGFKLRAR